VGEVGGSGADESLGGTGGSGPRGRGTDDEQPWTDNNGSVDHRVKGEADVFAELTLSDLTSEIELSIWCSRLDNDNFRLKLLMFNVLLPPKAQTGALVEI
jgi:hypothetical protein